MSKNANLIKSDISNLFQELETIATETKLEEKKKRGYVEPSVSDISNLFEGLEEASRQAKELSTEDTEKLGAFSGLMEQMTSITKKVEDEVTTQINEVVTEFVEEEDKPKEFIEEKTEQPPEKSTDIIEKIVDNLDEMRYTTEVKEELDQIEALRKEFEQYKTALQNQVTKGLATSSGGGEVRLEFLDDVDRDTAKVDGKFLKFDSSSGKFVGDDASAAAGSLSGSTLASNVTASSLTSLGTSVTVAGSSGITLSQGSISLKNGGTQSRIDFYCESSNAHYARLQAPAHSAFSGNVTLTLPATTDTIAGIASSQTLTNKTFTSPTIDTFTFSSGTSTSGMIVGGTGIVFEGSTADAHETTLTAAEPTQDNTITIPDSSMTLLTTATHVNQASHIVRCIALG